MSNPELETFQVLIEETLARTVEVRAANADEARAAVRQQYDAEEIVLNSSDFQEHRVFVLGEDL